MEFRTEPESRLFYFLYPNNRIQMLSYIKYSLSTGLNLQFSDDYSQVINQLVMSIPITYMNNLRSNSFN